MMTIIQTGMAFFYGFSIGLFNSVPLGPINFSIIETSFKKGFPSAFMIGLGALVIDVVYCVVGVFGVSLVQEYVVQLFQPFGFPVLTFLGGRLIYLGWKGHLNPSDASHHPVHATRHFSMGFLIILTNPMAMTFWIVTMGFVFAYGLISSSVTDKVGFVAGMTLGTGIWFFVLARFVSWKRQTISVLSIRIVSVATGMVLVCFGTWLGYAYWHGI